jgi:hypothetical protein
MKNIVSEDSITNLLLGDPKNNRISEILLDNGEESSFINFSEYKDTIIDFEFIPDNNFDFKGLKKPKKSKKYKMHSPELKLKCLELVKYISYT